MERIYQPIIIEHFQHDIQMLFLAGPRQVGKTTLSYASQSLTHDFYYMSWDEKEHQKLIVQGSQAIADYVGLHKLMATKSIMVFDEIHKYRKWKQFLKGFYDQFKGNVFILVTGSARLNIFRRGADSLMGRYFLYRIHPFSVAEILRPSFHEDLISAPKKINDADFQALWEYGGFPDPYLRRDTRFHRRWLRNRTELLIHEDIRDLSRVQELAEMQLLADLLINQVGQLINRSSFAKKINVSVKTISNWLKILESVYYCFAIQPWSKNVTRSLIKEPKYYLWDWSLISDAGTRAENFVAMHLLKAVHFWTDNGYGDFGLYFLRDKEKNEVDFLVTKNKKPWFLVEVKLSANHSVSKALYRYHEQLKTEHAFQVVLDMDYVDADCFKHKAPIVVPAKTFLSQLI